MTTPGRADDRSAVGGVDANTWRPARIRAVMRETTRAATLRLEVPGWPGHRPGQRVDLRLTAEDGYTATRAYSIAAPWTASGATGSETVDVTVQEVDDGEVSPYLTGVARAGDELELRGPIGGAFAWEPADGGPLLLVGGGSGLVPLMAMVRAHAAHPAGADVRVLVSARTAGDVLYRDELHELAEQGTVTLLETLTRSVPTGASAHARRVDAALLAELGPAPSAAPAVFVCGPDGFVEAAVGGLLALGHDPGAIRTERFGPNAG